MKSLKLSITYFALVGICLIALVGVAKADESADLSITKTINGASTYTARQGETLEITLVCTNNGPSTATSVTVTDFYNNRYKIKNVVSMPDDCEDTGENIKCKIDEIESGEDVTLTYSIEVNKTATSGTSENFASISSPLNDPVTDNNQVVSVLRVIQSRAVELRVVDNVQLSLTKLALDSNNDWQEADSKDTAATISLDDTQNVTYQTLVYNDGTQTAYAVEVSDAFAGDNVKITSISNIKGATWDSDKEVFVIDRIASKEIVSVTYVTTLKRTGTGDITAVNVATIENAEYQQGLLTDPSRVNIEGIGSADAAYIFASATKSTTTTKEPEPVVSNKTPTAVAVNTATTNVSGEITRNTNAGAAENNNTGAVANSEAPALPATGSSLLIILATSLLAAFGIRKFATKKA